MSSLTFWMMEKVLNFLIKMDLLKVLTGFKTKMTTLLHTIVIPQEKKENNARLLTNNRTIEIKKV